MQAPYDKGLSAFFARTITPFALAALTALAAHCGGGSDGGDAASGAGGAPGGGNAAGVAGVAGGKPNPFQGGSGGVGQGGGGAAGAGGEASGGVGGAGGAGGAGESGAAGAGGGLTGVDGDDDGIDDGLEDTLAKRFAPLLRLTEGETFLPGSVAWYLPRVHMRFDHGGGCFDHEIVALGKATAGNLSQQKHQSAGGLPLCNHGDDQLLSNAEHLEFFLQPPDDDVHEGAPPADWRAYAHVKKSGASPGGYDVQYWFFYPFNSTTANIDHEGDWEHITVVADASGALAQARYAAHSGGTTHPASALEFVPGTSRPVGYVAIGTHATYHRPGSYTTEVPVFTDRADGEGPTFDTALGLVNVGERGAPLNGQAWVDYGGRWGEIGNLPNTSGPPTPSFQGAWTGL